MLSYGIRRLLAAIPILFVILTLTFFLIHLAPGDPLSMFESPDIDPAAREQMRRIYGLDAPLPVQYLRWVRDFFFRGEFGTSFQKHRPVADLLAEAIPNTLLLAGLALLAGFVIGGAIGILSALRAGSRGDFTLSLATLTLYSLPSFWLALELILVFSLWLGWLPSSHIASVGAAQRQWFPRIIDRFAHLILPVLTLGIAPAAMMARYLRSSLIEVIHQDFIRTARAKGIAERFVVLKHALANSLLPILTLAGLSIPILINGSLIVEVIFSWPGMGRVIYEAVFARDYPVIIATTFLASCLVILGNLMADLSYALADPRIRLERHAR